MIKNLLIRLSTNF